MNEILDKAEYGTLALCDEGKPFSVPVNFVMLDEAVYFHGSHKGRKMSTLAKNAQVSFSVVENYSLIQSYFSSTDGSACPSTQFFKSVVIDGRAIMVEKQEEKAKVLESLMQKLQPEGKYIPLSHESYEKSLKATAVVKIEIDELKCKFKFGQHLNQERFDMVVKYLEQRGEEIDLETVALMKKMKG
jgi:nitroimidazol reductase NimA-like FMN-containing flavoprotein (pyridoxamine 5'-phosphate oxidase superfamily)